MGNFNTCLNLKNSLNTQNMAKLVDSQGQLRLVKLPITVAEIMLENPGFALTPVDNELRRTHRAPAMRADDMLLGRKVYLLVPVNKVNSRLSDLQLAAVESALIGYSCIEKVGRRTPGGSKVSPVVESTGLAGSDEGLEHLVKDMGEKCISITSQGKRFSKVAWEPVLEPILEGC